MLACKIQVGSWLTRMPFINGTWQRSIKSFFVLVWRLQHGKISPDYLGVISPKTDLIKEDNKKAERYHRKVTLKKTGIYAAASLNKQGSGSCPRHFVLIGVLTLPRLFFPVFFYLFHDLDLIWSSYSLKTSPSIITTAPFSFFNYSFFY